MAAFTFPENPQNGDTTKNNATGLTYVFVAAPAPGKWEVQMRDADADYVNIDGDTMTGPLNITPTLIPYADQQASLMAKASPFSAAASTQNYISRVFQANTNDDVPIFRVQNDDAANLPIRAGRKSTVSIYAADTLIQPSLNNFTFDDFPTDGIVSGFRVGGRQEDLSSGNVLDTTYYETRATAINYYGEMTSNNSLVTKQYVDTAIQSGTFSTALPTTGGTMTGQIAFNMSSGDPINVNSGKFKVGNNGAVNMKSGFTLASGNIAVNEGNITATQGAANAAGDLPSNGRLVTKTNAGAVNFTAYPNGNVLLTGILDFGGTNASKVLRGYNDSNPEFVFKLGNSAAAAAEKLKITTIGTVIQGGLDVEGVNGQYAAQFKGNVFLESSGSSVNVNTFGASNANLEIYVGETASSSTRQIAIYEGSTFIFNEAYCYDTLSVTNATTLSSTLNVTGKGTFSGNLTCNTFNALNGGTFSGSGSTVEYLFNGGTVTFMNQGVKNYSGLMQTNKDTTYLMGNNVKYTYYPDTVTVDYQGNDVDPILIINGKNKLTEVRQKVVIPQKISISAEASGTNINSFLNLGASGHFTFQVNDSTQWSSSNTVLYIGTSGLVSYKDIQLVQSKKITGLGTCTSGSDAANKTYVDNTTTSVTATLKSTLHAAVNGSTDYASLKAALLAALA